MELIKIPLTKKRIEELHKKYGDYTKVTVDIENGYLVIGCLLHADAETLLYQRGSVYEDIWGGGVNFATKQFDAMAVLNIRPSSGNTSMEIIDEERRNKFLNILKKIFAHI